MGCACSKLWRGGAAGTRCNSARRVGAPGCRRCPATAASAASPFSAAKTGHIPCQLQRFRPAVCLTTFGCRGTRWWGGGSAARGRCGRAVGPADRGLPPHLRPTSGRAGGKLPGLKFGYVRLFMGLVCHAPCNAHMGMWVCQPCKLRFRCCCLRPEGIFFKCSMLPAGAPCHDRLAVTSAERRAGIAHPDPDCCS